MKRKIVLIVFVLISAPRVLNGQIIDSYGINLGVSYSTQLWDYQSVPINLDTYYKAGLMAFIQAEKAVSKRFALRTELGYIQKGFKNKFEWMSADGASAHVNKDNVVLHDLALNLALKVKPYESDYSPYLVAGFRGDYLIAYQDVVIEEPESGLTWHLFESAIEEFNKLNVGGLLGIGIEFKKWFYLELEYNPNLTKNFKGEFLRIRDNCWGVKLGLNMNKLVKL